MEGDTRSEAPSIDTDSQMTPYFVRPIDSGRFVDGASGNHVRPLYPGLNCKPPLYRGSPAHPLQRFSPDYRGFSIGSHSRRYQGAAWPAWKETPSDRHTPVCPTGRRDSDSGKPPDPWQMWQLERKENVPLRALRVSAGQGNLERKGYMSHPARLHPNDKLSTGILCGRGASSYPQTYPQA